MNIPENIRKEFEIPTYWTSRGLCEFYLYLKYIKSPKASMLEQYIDIEWVKKRKELI